MKLTPIQANFEHFIIDFADVNYQYQANTADYQDKTHAAYYGRGGNPLTSRMHSVGISTLSQALRVAATITREEIGGVSPTEWRNARVANWKTTVLALDTGIGQVVGIEHPDVPLHRSVVNVSGTTVTYVSGDPFTDSLVGEYLKIGDNTVLVDSINSENTQLTTDSAPGDGSNIPLQSIESKYRITSWKLKKDWSIEIEGRAATGSMYDLDVGPKPADVLPKPLPILFYPQPQGEWSPYQIQARSTDALYPSEWSFLLRQNYTAITDGSSPATISAIGKLPVNEFIPNCGAVTITKGKVTQSTTGGFLQGGKTYRVMVCARNTSGTCTPPSNVIIVQVPTTTDTNSITLHGVMWPKVTRLVDYVVFLSDQDDLIHEQQIGTLTGTGDGTTYTPADIPITGPIVRDTWGVPNPNITKVRLKTTTLWHGGVLGSQVHVISGSTITSFWTIDPTGADNWTGRILTIIGRSDTTPFLSFNITAFNPSTGLFTLDQPAVTETTLWADIDAASTTLTVADASLFPQSGQFRINLDNEMMQVVAVNADTFTVLRGIDGSTAASHAAGTQVYAPDHSIQVGDAFVVSMKGYDNSDNPTVFSDPGLSNALNFDFDTHAPTPHSGLPVHGEKGYVLRVIAGFNRGKTAKVVDNDATSYSLDRDFLLDETSVVVVQAAGWEYSADSASLSNADPMNVSSVDIPSTLAQKYDSPTSLLVGGFTVDKNGVESEDGDGPIRMLFPNYPQIRTITADDSQQINDGLVFVDTTAGNVTFTLLPAASIVGLKLIVQKISGDSNTVTILPAPGSGDLLDGQASVTLTTQWSKFFIKASS